MKKALLLALSAAYLFAGQVNWVKSYDEAVAKAKKENKGIFVLLETQGCQWCKKLKAETLSDNEVSAKINANFVAVRVDRDNDKYPQKLYARMVPTSYFFDKNEKALLKRPVIGFWDAENFSSYTDDALKNLKK